MLFSLPDFTFLQGTISDQTGAFNIKSNETKGVLPISSVGYSTILLPCTSSNMGTIQLYSDAQLLYSRPYYAQLRSNVMYINRYTYEGGNPFLLPSLWAHLHSDLNTKKAACRTKFPAGGFCMLMRFLRSVC